MTEDVEVEQVEHDDSPGCWCGPRLFEPCAECDSIDNQKTLSEALAVHVPTNDFSARRPKKAKGCWKCGGDGLIEVEEHGGGPIAVIHNNVSRPKILVEGD